MEMVLLLSNGRKLPQLRIGEHPTAASHGLGGLCPSISVFVYLSDPKLCWATHSLRHGIHSLTGGQSEAKTS